MRSVTRVLKSRAKMYANYEAHPQISSKQIMKYIGQMLTSCVKMHGIFEGNFESHVEYMKSMKRMLKLHVSMHGIYEANAEMTRKNL